MDHESHSILGFDASQLLIILESLEKDLQYPYRSRPKLDEKDLEQQISHYLNHISNLEEDLKASIGISKYLIKSFESFSKSKNTIAKESESSANNSLNLTLENTTLRDELGAAEEKYYEALKNLENIEEENSKLRSELNKTVRENSRYSLHLSLTGESDTESMSKLFNKLSSKYDKSIKLIKDLEDQLIYKDIEISDLEDLIAEKQKIIDDLQVEDSLKRFSSNFASTYADSSSPSKSICTKIEFNKFDDVEPSQESIMYPCTPMKIFEVVNTDNISIKASTSQFQDLTEEIFFNMTLSCVKMNLSQFSGLCVDEKEMYRTAIKAKVPIHKWGIWIESQFNLLAVKNNLTCKVVNPKRKN